MEELKLERVYHQPADLAGYRILVDRLWPRGISKVKAQLDWWPKEIGPSTDLRKWYGHDPAKFPDFKARYLAELAANPAYPELLARVKEELVRQPVILLFGAKDEEHNQAVVLAEKLRADLAAS